MTEPAARRHAHTLGWAIALSAGLHALVMMTLDLSWGPWRHGLQPALQVTLRPAPGPTEVTMADTAARAPAAQPAPRKPPATPAERGGPSQVTQAGSSLPIPVRYYSNREVDVPAVPVERGALVIPEHAYISRLFGTVRARLFIDETGVVASVQIVDVQPVSGLFEQAAIEALQSVRYAPAQIAGRPVRSQRLVEVVFDPYEDRPSR